MYSIFLGAFRRSLENNYMEEMIIMRKNDLSKIARNGFLVLCFALATALAMPAQSNNTNTTRTETRTVERDDDTDWGWLGLLGLLGLAGLIPKKRHVEVANLRDTDRGTTGTTGTNR